MLTLQAFEVSHTYPAVNSGDALLVHSLSGNRSNMDMTDCEETQQRVKNRLGFVIYGIRAQSNDDYKKNGQPVRHTTK
jgi:hypothetical protein